MSFPRQAVDTYRQTQVRSRTPLELVVMLYDGALRFLATAASAMERGDIPARREAMSRALAIIGELQNTLDLEQGGELAASLDELYAYATRRLLEATQQHDAARVEEVRRLLEILRDGWSQIAAPEAVGAGARS
jgi:flagellar protein FliS